VLLLVEVALFHVPLLLLLLVQLLSLAAFPAGG
jgi:hypothetical protein